MVTVNSRKHVEGDHEHRRRILKTLGICDLTQPTYEKQTALCPEPPGSSLHEKNALLHLMVQSSFLLPQKCVCF